MEAGGARKRERGKREWRAERRENREERERRVAFKDSGNNVEGGWKCGNGN